jgi:pilus assembly protein Flp/PilA
MLNLYVSLQHLLREKSEDETGATAVEYGMMVALIAAVIIGLVTTLGTDINKAFQSITDALPS